MFKNSRILHEGFSIKSKNHQVATECHKMEITGELKDKF